MLKADSLRVVLRQATTARPILRGVSLELRPGEIRALVGESGSGKTVTALALIGLLPRGMDLVGGKVSLGDTDVTALDEAGMERLRGRRMSMVFRIRWPR